jgi:hypothetical protein
MCYAGIKAEKTTRRWFLLINQCYSVYNHMHKVIVYSQSPFYQASASKMLQLHQVALYHSMLTT